MIGAEPGQVIDGRFELGERLGEGAFGVTFAAEDHKRHRQVVLKIAGSAAGNVQERLQQEARALGALRHPRIVAFHQLGVLPDGRTYLVFERVHGESLATRMRRQRPLPVGEALTIARAIAEALQHAHGQGIIHRDIKPSNVLLPGADPGAAKLADFGALGRLDEGAMQNQTRAGQLFGTILYMAPEQVRAEPQTASTDVYGLGALLHEMLFGGPPFYEKHGSIPAFIAAIVTEPAELPGHPPMPPPVRELLARMLAKQQDQRPPLDEVMRILAAADEPTREGAASVSIAAPQSDQSAGAPVRPAARGTAIVVGAGFVLALALLIGASSGAVSIRTMLAILLGIALGVSGPLLARELGRRGDRRLGRAQREANQILTGTRSPDVLGSTLSRYVQELTEQCRRVDERILGATIARMVADYEAAEDFDQRQAALMNAIELLDRLMERLAPWWVRHQKALAFAISLIGVLSGVLSIIVGVADLMGR